MYDGGESDLDERVVCAVGGEMSDCGLSIPDLSAQYAEARRIDPTMTSEKFAHRCGELMRMRALELIKQEPEKP